MAGGGGRPYATRLRTRAPPLTNYRFLEIDELVFGSSASANF
jgi:hypothetical protein